MIDEEAEPPPPAEVAVAHGDIARLDELALVLTALAIAHRVDADSLWVGPADADAARAALAAYEAENAPAEAEAEPPTYGETLIGAVLALLILLAFAAQDSVPRWEELGAADAERIRAGEWWRCATALSLHADAAHAGGNAAFGGIALTALAHRLGPAAAAWTALVAGVCGNALTALVLRGGHISIGASTAVFGLLGALAAAQIVGPKARRRWLSLGAGVALLGLLGTGPRSDLFGHLFGMLSGFVFGAAASLAIRTPPRRSPLQPLGALAAVAALAGFWIRALR